MATKQECYSESSDNIAAKGKTSASTSAVGAEQTASTSSSLDGKKAEPQRNDDGLLTKFDDAIDTVAGGMDVASKAIEDGTRALAAIDCSDKLYDFLKDNVPLFSTVSGAIDSVADFLHGVSSGISISSLISSPDFVKTACGFIEKWYGMLMGYIDVGIKAAIVWFNKIDAARLRLENAMLDFTETIKYCILDVINSLRDKIFDLLNFSLKIDWSALQRLMESCPCFTVIIANLMGCTEDPVTGGDISHDARAVILCVQEKFKFMDPSDLMVGLEQLIGKYVKKYIMMIFGYLESWLVYIFTMLIKPLRMLIKSYVGMLTYKMDMSAFIKMLGPFECLFVYSNEVSKSGNKYYGMSIIDMINTMKGWVGCFELPCPGIGEKIKNRMKEVYKDLRLDDKYWRRAQEADIYTMCLATELAAPTARETVLRELYNESPLDLLLNWLTKSKNNDDDTSEDDELADQYDLNHGLAFGDIAKKNGDTNMDAPSNQISSISDAVNFAYTLETENAASSGTRPITKREESLCKKIVSTMSSEKGDPYYTEHLYQFVRFTNCYATSKEYVLFVQDKLNRAEELTANFLRNSTTSIPFDGGRPSIFENDPMGHINADGTGASNPVVVDYEVPYDFDRDRYEKISNMKFTGKYTGEPRAAYYARMFNNAVK